MKSSGFLVGLGGTPATSAADRLTGARPWCKPFAVEHEFTYNGIGETGGY